MISYLRWQDFLDIIIIAFLVYKVLLFIKGTRAAQLLFGLLILFCFFYLSKKLELSAASWILDNFFTYAVLIVVIIFQDDIRRMLLEIGRSPFLKRISYVEATLFFDELVNALAILSAHKIGALVVIERKVGLEDFMEVGTRLDAEVNTELILSIFQPSSPLHDGAVIIKEGRIRAAKCILPLSMNEESTKGLGTRHRAALGISEITDAIAICVSEERGHIAYAVRGNLEINVKPEALKRILNELLS
ncbi:MAG: diadenylate cyclase CdaA [Desulfobacterota bacterium]|nr:diadenylate cyclase CdaA [Thermodesulfobacteriota bacterium]MDW8002264.1 diadenylate cyclase CdaA [Deltaproteobacteria bacterium]